MLPVSAVCILFIILLFLLIDQKRSNNALVLEYNASKIINLLLDLHVNNQQIIPSEIDENIIGYGIYDKDRQAVSSWGSAPQQLPASTGRNNEIRYRRNKSIIIVRTVLDNRALPPGVGAVMQHMSPNMQRRLQEYRDDRNSIEAMPPMMQKYQAGVFLEYSNASYVAEQRLIFFIIILFIIMFTTAFVFVYRLYQSNKHLLVQSEHDKQLIQLGEAARTLAHEIRNPLSALKIQRDLLVKKLPGGYETNLEVIDRELKRLNTLVERVGEFLRNPVGRPERINLYEFISRLYCSRTDIAITENQKDIFILFDSERLRTVIDNIVNNAVESGGSAAIEVNTSGRSVFLKVSDKGEGFTEEALKRLFDPFFTTKNSGTGLGLSVVRRLMESTGGKVEVTNLKSGGASVVLMFGEMNESSDS